MNSIHDHRRAVVTGAGAGLGRELVFGLVDRGYVVHGTALSQDEAEEVAARTDGAATLVVCDVTDKQAVHELAARVSSVADDSGLDLLINNAATITPGPLELLDLADIRAEFEVNVLGCLSVVNAFLPALRRTRSRGRIVLIGSRASHFPMPFNGVCSATKAALDVLADIYRAELTTSGVDVVVAVLGGMATGGLTGMPEKLGRIRDSMTDAQHDLYGAALEGFTLRVRSSFETAMSAREAAAAVIELAEAVRAPTRVAIGQEAENAMAAAHALTDVQKHVLRTESIGPH